MAKSLNVDDKLNGQNYKVGAVTVTLRSTVPLSCLTAILAPQVGIIGAGAAGLFTGLLFDYLKKEYGLKVDWEILEVHDEKRVGGRLYTHHFSEDLHDYYDVGAMRFPESPIMQR